MNPEEWRFTCASGLHRLFATEFSALPGELVVASAILSPENWYVFTTRRLVSCFKSHQGEADLSKLQRTEFGNFKGYGVKPVQLAEIPAEVATFNFSDGSELQIEYETGKASMVPIYAAKFWQQKYPILDKLN